MLDLQDRYWAFMRQFPKRCETDLSIWGLLAFEDIAVFDAEGDVVNKMPHAYVKLNSSRSFFTRTTFIMSDQQDKYQVDRPEYTRVNIFPQELPPSSKGTFHSRKVMKASWQEWVDIMDNYCRVFYRKKDEYAYWQHNDCVPLDSSKGDVGYLRLRVKYQISVAELLENVKDAYKVKKNIDSQIGSEVAMNDKIFVYEFDMLYALPQ